MPSDISRRNRFAADEPPWRVYEDDSINSGSKNTCDDPYGWHDDGYLGCSARCPNVHCEGNGDEDRDVDGSDLVWFLTENPDIGLDVFAADFGRTDCPE